MEQQANKPTGKMPWAAYAIIEKGDKTFWNRVGSAFINRDGSWNLYLDSIPLDGKIQIRESDRDKDGKMPARKGQLAQASEELV